MPIPNQLACNEHPSTVIFYKLPDNAYASNSKCLLQFTNFAAHMQAKCGVYSSLGTKHCTISGSGLLCCHEEKSYSNRKKAGKYQKSKYNV